MAKYKKKKVIDSQVDLIKDSPQSSTNAIHISSDASTPDQKRLKKLAMGSLKLQFAGDLVLVKNPQKVSSGLFKRYTELFEAIANMEKDQRNLMYRFMVALMLTSHAKKSTNIEEKRRIFDLKNQLYISMGNERSLRRLFEFKYLVSKNFRVLSYCEECLRKNTLEKLDKHKWKYCKTCKVDHNFYNLLSMEVKFQGGYARLFLSNDQIPLLKGLKLPRKVKAGDLSEEAVFERYHYNSRNLDAIDLSSVELLERKLKLQPLTYGQQISELTSTRKSPLKKQILVKDS